MMNELNRQSCFVIAPPSAETAGIRQALRDYGCEPFFISDYLSVGHISITEIRTAFRSVDFVVALLLSNCPLESVFFELGVAIGLGRRILVLAEPDVRLPTSVARIEVRRGSFRNDSFVREALSSFLLPPPPAEVVPSVRRLAEDRSPPRKVADRNALQAFISLLHVELSREAPQERAIEKHLLQILSEARITAVEAPSTRNRNYSAPDIALWLNDSQKEVGNPIAIEIKATRKPFDLGEAVDRLAENLKSVDAKTGILLHLQGSEKTENYVYQTNPLIFVFSVEEFVTHVEAGNLGPYLRKLGRAAAGTT